MDLEPCQLEKTAVHVDPSFSQTQFDVVRKGMSKNQDAGALMQLQTEGTESSPDDDYIP